MTTTLKSKPYSYLSGCPEGFHKRSGYTRKNTGTKVGARCVRSTTTKKETSKEFKKSVTAKQTRRLKKLLPSIKSLQRKACPPGMIERKEYARKYTTAILEQGYTKKTKLGKEITIVPHKGSITFVAPKCVKDVGLPGKGLQTIGPLRQGELSKYGYGAMKPEAQRHEALKEAIQEYGGLGVWRKLNAVANLTERSIPKAHKIYVEDKDWVKRKYGLKAF